MIDVINHPGGSDLLQRTFGLRKVPVVAKNGKYVFGTNLDGVAKFIGLAGRDVAMLPAAQLFDKYRKVFGAGAGYARQFPPQRFAEQVIPNRPRDIRSLNHHLFRIGEAFLEAWDGAEYTEMIANTPPGASLKTGDEVARYGEQVWSRLEMWWKNVDERGLQRMVRTYFGDVTIHHLLERSTWHSAQHARQLATVLERMQITPGLQLTAADLAGLPLPEGLWE